MRDASTVTSASQLRHVEALKEELAATRSQAQRESSQAKLESQAHADQLARQIKDEEAKVQQQVSSEISSVKETAAQQNQQVAARVADVATDVGSVKTQVATTPVRFAEDHQRSEIDAWRLGDERPDCDQRERAGGAQAARRAQATRYQVGQDEAAGEVRRYQAAT